MILGFMSLILVGALLLMTPIASRGMHWTSFENSLFTATSAVCVTGLVVRDTATYWSTFGQAVILILIQIGGLGIITITAFFAAAWAFSPGTILSCTSSASSATACRAR